MNNLIGGKEALIAWANGEEVLIKSEHWDNWTDLTIDFTLEVFSLNEYQFRLKPKTITLNGVEVPAPFDPKKGDMYYRINPSDIGGLYYKKHSFSDDPFDRSCSEFGVWRTEGEIKQVVAALRSVFKTN